MIYSFSNLELFKKCPKAWEYRYIQKLKGTLQANTHLKRGSNIHLLLEHFEELCEYLKTKDIQKLDFYFKENEISLKDFMNSEELKIVLEFANSELGKDILYKKSVREQEILFDSDFNVFLGDRKDSNFVGFIDRVNISDDSLELIDFKTGKYKEPNFQKYDQLMVYAMYMFKRYKVNKIKIRFVYVEHNLENSLELSPSMIEFWSNSLKNTVTEIQNTKRFKKNKNNLCPWCDFVLICDPKLIKNRKDYDKIKDQISKEILEKIEN